MPLVQILGLTKIVTQKQRRSVQKPDQGHERDAILVHVLIATINRGRSRDGTLLPLTPTPTPNKR